MAAYVAGMAMGRTALPVVLGVVFHPHAGETVLHQTMPAAGVLSGSTNERNQRSGGNKIHIDRYADETLK